MTLTSRRAANRNLPKVHRTGNTDDEMSTSTCSMDGGALTSLRVASGHHDDDDTEAVLSDASSQPDVVMHPSMLESWLMTPTPIFDLGEDLKSRLPVGPLENELIEHPSMSVYHSRGRPSSVGHCSSGSESVDMAPASTSSVSTVPSATSKRSRRAAAVAAVATTAAVVTHTHSSHSHELLQRQTETAMRRSVRAQQAKKQRKEQKQLKRSQLQRRNDVAQKLSARPPRRNQLQSCSRRSYAVNDRKSQ